MFLRFFLNLMIITGQMNGQSNCKCCAVDCDIGRLDKGMIQSDGVIVQYLATILVICNIK
jgi:hypothetical protein